MTPPPDPLRPLLHLLTPDPLRPLLHLLTPDTLTLADALRIISLLIQSAEAAQDPNLQRALADAMRQGADRLRI